MKEEKIFLVPYDPNWPIKFQNEKELLEKAIGGYITGGVHHVGSTAIAGLLSKPTVDILVGVEGLAKSKPCIEILETVSYVYFPYKEKYEHWFLKPSPAHREFHLHLMPTNSPEFKAKIAFRDYLLLHPEEIERYEDLKLELVKKFENDREAYTQAKAEFVRGIVRKVLGSNFIFEA